MAAGLLALITAWTVSLERRPALYDGLPLTVEPYRYLHPPAGYPTTSPPTSVETTVLVSSGRVQATQVMTTESGPQAQIVFAPGAFAVPPDGATLRIRIDPVDPPSVAPKGQVDGNVYRFSAAAGQRSVDFTGGGLVATVTLQGTGATGSPVLEEFRNGSWTVLTTHAADNPGFYGANVAHLGLVALVFPPVPGSVGSGGGGAGSSSLGLLIALGVGGLILVGAVIAVRRSRRPAPLHQGRQLRPPPRGGRR